MYTPKVADHLTSSNLVNGQSTFGEKNMETTIAQNILRIVLGLILAAILFFGMAHKVRKESVTVRFFETLVFGVVSAMPTIGISIFILMALLNVFGLMIPENKNLRWTLALTIPVVVIAILFGGYSF